MKNYTSKLEEAKLYHIYNRGNNSELIFYNKANYVYFLKKYHEYLGEIINTYTFSLLPNHFHLLVSVKESSAEMPPIEKVASLKEDKVSFQFRKFFTSYAMSINKQQNRHGSLFEKPFRRIEINNTKYLQNLIFNIYANPLIHGISDDFKTYQWSSYQRILIDKPSHLNKKAVLDHFENKNNFIHFHKQKAEIEKIKHLILE